MKSRKGFKYSVLDKPVSTEVAEFDEVDTVVKSKRKAVSEGSSEPKKVGRPSLRDNNNSNNNNNNRAKSTQPVELKNASKSSAAAASPSSSRRKKARYPHISWEPTDALKRSCSGRSAKETLLRTLEDISDTEVAGLQNYFDTNGLGNGTKNGTVPILEAAREVLRTLHVELQQQLPDDVLFFPEMISTEDKEEMLALQEEVLGLQSSLERTEAALHNVSEFMSQHQLNPVAGKEASTGPPQLSKKCNELRQGYEALLHEMDRDCSAVLTGISRANGLAASAKQAQGRLYDAFQECRFVARSQLTSGGVSSIPAKSHSGGAAIGTASNAHVEATNDPKALLKLLQETI